MAWAYIRHLCWLPGIQECIRGSSFRAFGYVYETPVLNWHMTVCDCVFTIYGLRGFRVTVFSAVVLLNGVFDFSER